MSAVYDWLLASASSREPVQGVLLGLNWTLAESAGGCGFAFSPRQVPRTLGWAGALAGRSAAELRPWLRSWDAAEAAVGLAVLNAGINARSPCLAEAVPLRAEAPEQLSLFAITVVPQNYRAATANLKSPIAIHFKERLGMQVILDNRKYSVRFRLFAHERTE